MRAAVLHSPGLVRVEDVPDPVIEAPTDAILRVVATCVCGSDLWWYRGANGDHEPLRMGHEYVGVVEEVGSEVRSLGRGDHVIGSFVASDGTCDACLHGYTSRCRNGVGILGAQAEFVRIPLADGTLVALPGEPAADHVASLLALSDVAATGWFAAVAGRVETGSTVAVSGDGAVGLLAVLAASRMGASRIIAMSRTPARQALARRFGATDVVEARGDEGAALVRELTDGTGVDSALECVGTPEAMTQAIVSARIGGSVGFVGVPHGIELSGRTLFDSLVAVQGGPAPVRRFLPELIDLVRTGAYDPGPVFDLELPLGDAAEGYRAMDERRSIKALLRP